MLRISLAAEPPVFNNRVRIPGTRYLSSVPRGSKIKFRGKEYWRKILDELHDAYSGICAYTCHFIPYDTGGDTVEHFKPKMRYPNLAYEWNNYRLVSNRMNGRRGVKSQIVDPFLVQPGMFTITFPSLQVKVGDGLGVAPKRLAKSTILNLKLNHERNVKARLEYVVGFRDGRYSLRHLALHAPFIHAELARQGIDRKNLTAMMPRSLYKG